MYTYERKKSCGLNLFSKTSTSNTHITSGNTFSFPSLLFWYMHLGDALLWLCWRTHLVDLDFSVSQRVIMTHSLNKTLCHFPILLALLHLYYIFSFSALTHWRREIEKQNSREGTKGKTNKSKTKNQNDGDNKREKVKPK